MLEGYRTYIVALAAIMVAIGTEIQAYYAGQPINYSSVIEALIALAMMFFRKGMKDLGSKV